MPKKQALSADSFSKRNIREVIINDPDVLVGSATPTSTQLLMYDFDKVCFFKKYVDISAAEIKIFKEILSNATDNVSLTVISTNTENDILLPYHEWKKPDFGTINIKITDTSVYIKNYGNPIPIQPCRESTEKELILPPHLSFGVPFAGTNNNKARLSMGAGKNGIGAKATNILSSKFIVKIGNNIDGQEFEGEWINNMEKMSKNSVIPGFVYNEGEWKSLANSKNRYNEKNYVEVKYFPYSPNHQWGKITYDKLCFFAQLAASASFSSRVPIKFEYNVAGKSGKFTFWFEQISDFLKLFGISTNNFHEQMFWGPRANFGQIRLHGKKDIRQLSEKEQKYIAYNPMCLEDYPLMELYIFDTPSKGLFLTFVNGNENIGGGIHLKAITTPISNFVKEKLNRPNDKTIESLLLQNITIVCMVRVLAPTYDEQSKNTFKTYGEPKLDRELNYIFDEKGDRVLVSKTKLPLNNYEPKNWFGSWAAFQAIESAYSDKNNVKKLSNNKHSDVKKLEDAFSAGSHLGYLCTLYIPEGDAAKDYPTTMIDYFETRDFGGILPIRGKITNVTKLSREQFSKSLIIDSIVKAVGLQEEADYTKEEHVRTLRYGYICCMKDADVDGDHINTLIINFLSQKFPSFLKAGRYSYFTTPIIRVVREKHKRLIGPPVVEIIARFYNETEFENWWEVNKKKSYDPRYLKGLASSNFDDKMDDIEYGVKVVVTIDDEGEKYLYVAFGKDMSNMRKQWMYHVSNNQPQVSIQEFVKSGTYNPPTLFAPKISRNKRDINVSKLKIPEFKPFKFFREVKNIVNTDLVNYSVASLNRAIPSVLDGLKRSQRQALWVILNFWKYGNSDKKPLKVSRITGEITKVVHYKHGDTSMQMTIMKQCQCYTGGNNLPVYMRDGGFGTYWFGGKDMTAGRSRYVGTACERWHSLMFCEDMTKNVERCIEEGEEVEPKFIPMLIPLMLINGTKGLATGYCTFIPPHNLFDLIEWYISRCEDIIDKIPLPWYRGFIGRNILIDHDLVIEEKNGISKQIKEFIIPEKIEVDDNGDVENIGDIDDVVSDDDEEDDTNKINESRLDEFLNKNKGQRLESYGVYHIEKDNGDTCNIVIKQLPIGLYPYMYKEYMLEWEKNGWISGFNPGSEPLDKSKKGSKHKSESSLVFSEDIQVKIELFDVNKELLRVGYDSLKLKTVIGMSNMTLIDDKCNPIHFNNVGSIMNEHFKVMLNQFVIYKAKIIQELQEEKRFLINKEKFVELVKNKTINSDMPISEWKRIMKNAKIPEEYHMKLLSISISSIAKDEKEKLDRKIEEIKEKIIELAARTPNDIYKEKLLKLKEAFEKAEYPTNTNPCGILASNFF